MGSSTRKLGRQSVRYILQFCYKSYIHSAWFLTCLMDINSDASSDCDSQCSSRPEEVLCDYEKKRLENIKKNQEMMKTLGK